VSTTEKVDNYLGLPGVEGLNMADMFIKHAESLGVKTLSDVVTRITQTGAGFLVESAENSEMFNAVIFSGGSTPRKLGIPGEDLSGVSWCATCDGAFSAGEDVVLVGGGETAVEDSLYLSDIARNVTIVLRGKEFRATQPAVDRLLSKPNVRVIREANLVEIGGETEVENVRLSTGEVLPVYSVFEAIGQIPQAGPSREHVTLFENGFIQCSNVPGFFVAGDISTPEYRQIAVAVGDGARAGIDAVKWLQEN